MKFSSKSYIWSNVLNEQHNIINVNADSIEDAINYVDEKYDDYINSCKISNEMNKRMLQFKKEYKITAYYGEDISIDGQSPIKLSSTNIPKEIQQEILSNFYYFGNLQLEFNFIIVIANNILKKDIIGWMKNNQPKYN